MKNKVATFLALTLVGMYVSADIAVAALHAASQSTQIAALAAESAFISRSDVLDRVLHHADTPTKLKIASTSLQSPEIDCLSLGLMQSKPSSPLRSMKHDAWGLRTPGLCHHA